MEEHRRRRAWVLAGVLLAVGCARKPLSVTEVRGGTLATLRAEESIRSLHHPELVRAEDVGRSLAAHTPVLGFEVESTPVAMALRVLDDHEIVNLTLDEVPLAATW